MRWVRGHFKNVKGRLEFDDHDSARGMAEVTFDARAIWTGNVQRDDHLRSADSSTSSITPSPCSRGA